MMTSYVQNANGKGRAEAGAGEGEGSSDRDRLQAKVMIVAVLNSIFWLLLLILFWRIFSSVVSKSNTKMSSRTQTGTGTGTGNGTGNNSLFKKDGDGGGVGISASDGGVNEPEAPVKTNNFLGNDFLFLAIYQNDTMAPFYLNGNPNINFTTKGNIDEEVTMSAAVLTTFALIMAFHILLSFFLFYGAFKESVGLVLTWFCISCFLFGVDVICVGVGIVLSGFHIFICCKCGALLFFAYSLWLVFQFMAQLRAQSRSHQLTNPHGGSQIRPGRKGGKTEFSIPVLIVSPAAVQQQQQQQATSIQNYNHNFENESSPSNSDGHGGNNSWGKNENNESAIVASFPLPPPPPTPGNKKSSLAVPTLY